MIPEPIIPELLKVEDCRKHFLQFSRLVVSRLVQRALEKAMESQNKKCPDCKGTGIYAPLIGEVEKCKQCDGKQVVSGYTPGAEKQVVLTDTFFRGLVIGSKIQVTTRGGTNYLGKLISVELHSDREAYKPSQSNIVVCLERGPGQRENKNFGVIDVREVSKKLFHNLNVGDSAVVVRQGHTLRGTIEVLDDHGLEIRDNGGCKYTLRTSEIEEFYVTEEGRYTFGYDSRNYRNTGGPFPSALAWIKEPHDLRFGPGFAEGGRVYTDGKDLGRCGPMRIVIGEGEKPLKDMARKASACSYDSLLEYLNEELSNAKEEAQEAQDQIKYYEKRIQKAKDQKKNQDKKP